MPPHVLRTNARTAQWGFFSAALKPVIEIGSGETIVVETINGGPDRMPTGGFRILPEYAEVHSRCEQRLPGHLMTGPVGVRGARPGDVLQVDIEEIALRQDWGYNVVRPLWGALPDDFPTPRIVHIPIDIDRKIARLSWGAEIALRPFFGVMGTAPPADWGMVSSIEPRRNGGNIDLKELVAGTTLFLPVFTDGALLTIGDGHGAQGDGEVCVTAIETALTGRFRLTVRKDMALEWPYAETPTHAITMAFDPDLGQASRTALRSMIELVVRRTGLSREDAYMLLSIAADVRVTQLVNRNNGIHVMLERRHLERVRTP